MKKLILGAVIGIALGVIGMFFAMPRPTSAVCPGNAQVAAAKPAEAPAPKPRNDAAPRAQKNVHLTTDGYGKPEPAKRTMDKLP